MANKSKNLFKTLSLLLILFILLFVSSCKGKKVSFTLHNDDKTEVLEINKDELNNLELPSINKDGYTFNGWYFDDKYSVSFDISKIENDSYDLYAKFTKNDIYYTITYIAENGSITGNNTQSVKENEMGTEISVSPNEGYKFISWSDGKKEPIRSDFATKNITYTAIIEKLNKLTVINNNDEFGKLEGSLNQELLANENSTVIKASPNLGYKFKSWSNGSTNPELIISINEDTIVYANFEIEELDLPIININTLNNEEILSKDEYIKCDVSITNTTDTYTISSTPAKIKGRGNTTWFMPKKPYKLKFDEKIDLFGNGKAKSWTLIANFYDPSMLRNYMAYRIGGIVDTNYVTTTKFVDLYINSEYLGVYLVCEQNEVGKTRVNISDNIDNLNTGYLIELDDRAYQEYEKDLEYFILDNHSYVIKSPETDDELYNVDFLNYIKEYLELAYNSLDISYDEAKIYIDTSSFARSYIVHELFKMVDVDFSSFYMYKDKDGILCSGPIWDFDISAGNCSYENLKPDMIWASINPWYKKLLQYSEFKEEIKNILTEKYNDIFNEINNLTSFKETYTNSFNRNYEKWDIAGIRVWPTPKELLNIKTWAGQVDYLKHWLLDSLDYLINYYS